MKPQTLAWWGGLAMALVGGGLVLLGAYLLIEAGTLSPSLSLMLVGVVLVLVAQAASSLATGRQGINYIY